MRVFLDTEFTCNEHPEILSIGMVTEDGVQFYAEIDMQCPYGRRCAGRSTDFVHDIVLPLLGITADAKGTLVQMRSRVSAWIQGLVRQHGRIEVAYDYDTDGALLRKLLAEARTSGDIMSCVDFSLIEDVVSLMEDSPEARDCQGEVLLRGLDRHHALADALVLRASYLAAGARAAKG